MSRSRSDDHLNASYIQIDPCPHTYIAMSTPTTGETSEAFWRMILDDRVNAIVNLLSPNENDATGSTHVQYWPVNDAKKGLYVNLTFEMEIVPGELVIRSFVVYDSIQMRYQNVFMYQCATWREEAPVSIPTLVKLLFLVQAAVPQHNQPIVVSSARGVGRTGVFIAAHILHQLILSEENMLFQSFSFDEIMPRIVAKIQKQRPGMLNIQSQYDFLESVLEHLTNMTRGIPRNNSRQGYALMAESIGGQTICAKVFNNPEFQSSHDCQAYRSKMDLSAYTRNGSHTSAQGTLEKIGEGNFGSVYSIPDSQYTVKYLKDSTNAQNIIQRTLTVWKDVISHDRAMSEHFVRIVLANPVDGGVGIVMERMDANLEKVPKSFSGEVVLEMFYPLLRALYKLHRQGYSHYDIHPSNILYKVSQNTSMSPFPIAKFGDLDSLCETSKPFPSVRRIGYTHLICALNNVKLNLEDSIKAHAYACFALSVLSVCGKNFVEETMITWQSIDTAIKRYSGYRNLSSFESASGGGQDQTKLFLLPFETKIQIKQQMILALQDIKKSLDEFPKFWKDFFFHALFNTSPDFISQCENHIQSRHAQYSSMIRF